ncbi:MAG: hypothetical protein QM608_13965 [Caulobacter sp.]
MDVGREYSRDALDLTDVRRDHGRRLLRRRPDTAWLLAFDPDGHLRQAALESLPHPPRTRLEFLAVVVRLNDWVPQVRHAAETAARRLLPHAAPEAIAEAAAYLLPRRYAWSRWTDEAVVLDAALGRADVAAHVARDLETMTSGPGRAILQAMQRFPAMDAHLPTLAARARIPAIRAAALETLLRGRARWPVGHGWLWIDKSYGVRRRIVLTEERPLTITPDAAALIRAGAADRFALVRKVAVDALEARRADMADAADIARSLLGDPSGGVRARAEFLLRDA